MSTLSDGCVVCTQTDSLHYEQPCEGESPKIPAEGTPTEDMNYMGENIGRGIVYQILEYH